MNVRDLARSFQRSAHLEKWLRLTLAMLCAFGFLGFAHSVSAQGTTQISGVGYVDEAGICTDLVTGPNGQAPDFATVITGDLQGCLYTFVETYQCHPSGTYMERGSEIFVGDGSSENDGTFGTTYFFSAKYQDCANLIGEIHGFCQHPIALGSGTGDFEGVTGRIHFKDDIPAGNFPYTGHLKFN